jgi:hypothetical protein
MKTYTMTDWENECISRKAEKTIGELRRIIAYLHGEARKLRLSWQNSRDHWYYDQLYKRRHRWLLDETRLYRIALKRKYTSDLY